MANILVIDDDPAIRMFIQTALEYEGHEVEVRKNALEGLNYMRRGIIPDLVITDLLMSVMDGRTLVKEMRQDDKMKDVPVVIITGSIPKPEILPEEGQYQELLVKPFNVEDLFKTIISYHKYDK